MKKSIIALAAVAMFAVATPVFAATTTTESVATSQMMSEDNSALLNDLEKQINDYIKALKAGDVTKAAQIEKKINAIVSKLENAKLSSSEEQKLMKIVSKLADAAAELY